MKISVLQINVKLLSILVSLFVSIPAICADNNHSLSNNQEIDNEISVGYGITPITSVASVVGRVGGTLFSLGMISHNNSFDLGSINVEYGRRLKSWFIVGANLSYSMNASDVLDNQKNFKYRRADHFITFMPIAKFQWYEREKIGFYSKLAIGATFNPTSYSDGEDLPTTEDLHDIFPMAHVTLYGMEFTSYRFRLFTELGFGQCGILNLGCRYRF